MLLFFESWSGNHIAKRIDNKQDSQGARVVRVVHSSQTNRDEAGPKSL